MCKLCEQGQPTTAHWDPAAHGSSSRSLGEDGTAAANLPPLLRARDMLDWVTMNGARALKLDRKVGSLTPGKEADVVILDAEAINVAR